MGLKKWMLKFGPGSPVKAAKFFANQYKELATKNADWEIVFTAMYCSRVLAVQRLDPRNSAGGLLQEEDPRAIIEFSQGDICLFIFMLMWLETAQFRKDISIGILEINSIIEVIRETVEPIEPSMIKLDQKECGNNALQFAITSGIQNGL